MALALFVLLVAGYGGAFLTARRWMETGSSTMVFRWAAGLVAGWSILMALAHARGFTIGGLWGLTRMVLWLLVAALVVFLGTAYADGPPEEEPRHGAIRLGSGTFRCALTMLALAVVVGVLEGLGILGVGGAYAGSLLGVHWAFLIAAGALNLPCFLVAAAEKSKGGHGPGWFLGSVFGATAVALYSMQAFFEVVRGAIDFL